MDACVVVGCGNRLRGDDGVGVHVIERLRRVELPENVQLVDAGTGGMDVFFLLAGMSRAIIVDAVRSGAPPGTVFRVPAEELAELPAPAADLHSFRWDHAIALGRVLLKDRLPKTIEAYLVEVSSTDVGIGLSKATSAGADKVIAAICEDLRRRHHDAQGHDGREGAGRQAS
ncbi:MAG: hydrogenase maturation protease [Actinomycetota bacterium]|nr:hydrogenase maturation protease [Actinomycetota bacterium]